MAKMLFGSSQIKKVFWGSTAVKKIFWGSTLVWSAAVEISAPVVTNGMFDSLGYAFIAKVKNNNNFTVTVYYQWQGMDTSGNYAAGSSQDESSPITLAANTQQTMMFSPGGMSGLGNLDFAEFGIWFEYDGNTSQATDVYY